MKHLLLPVLLLAATAGAHELACPKIFPSEDVALSAAQVGGNASARLQRSHLSYAYMDSRGLFSEQLMVPPTGKRVRGGRDAVYGFRPIDQNWLICRYGGTDWGDGNVERWLRLDPNITRCTLRIREVKEKPYPTTWTATAVCE